MAAPKIRDTQGREARAQISDDKRLLDLFLGPVKTRHRSPVVSWWAAHRTYTKTEASKLLKRLQQLVPKMK